MQAELIIKQPSGVVRFSLEKGAHGVSGVAAGYPILVAPTATDPAPELLIEWDPSLRTLMWREAAAPRTRSQALRSGESFSHRDLAFTFSLKWDAPCVTGLPCESLVLEPAKIYLFGRGAGEPAEAGAVHVALDAQDRSISKLHARLCLENGEWILSDHSSTETLLNGEPFTRTTLIFGDRFKIGDYVFEFRGSQIDRVDHSDSGRIEAHNLSVIVKDRQTGNPLHILNDVGLRIGTGDFIGILGGSGSGKSTLLNALCGIRPADRGQVAIGGIENSLLNQLRPGAIGYVPQDDIVHPELVVRDAFYLAARLRLRLEAKQRKALVERTIELLGLAEHANKRVYHLSGGQRKRVSIGIELLSKPSVMFLDEPSSGLDPATEESLMELLQSLTLTNLTVVCTTHVLQKAYLFDRLVFVHGGRVIFEGNSSQAREFFVNRAGDLSDSYSGSHSTLGITKSPLEKIYSEVLRGRKSAAEWAEDFKQWSGYQAPGATTGEERRRAAAGRRAGRGEARAGPLAVSHPAGPAMEDPRCGLVEPGVFVLPGGSDRAVDRAGVRRVRVPDVSRADRHDVVWLQQRRPTDCGRTADRQTRADLRAWAQCLSEFEVRLPRVHFLHPGLAVIHDHHPGRSCDPSHRLRGRQFPRPLSNAAGTGRLASHARRAGCGARR